jgi:hypothetical protein
MKTNWLGIFLKIVAFVGANAAIAAVLIERLQKCGDNVQ